MCLCISPRWAELESEAKERERVLLGELEKGASSLLGAGKGRGGGAGNGLAGVEAWGERETGWAGWKVGGYAFVDVFVRK